MKRTIILSIIFLATIFNVASQEKRPDSGFFKKYFKSPYINYLAVAKHGYMFNQFDQKEEVKYFQLSDIKYIENIMAKDIKWEYLKTENKVSRFNEDIGEHETKPVINNNLNLKSRTIEDDKLTSIVKSTKIYFNTPILKSNNKALKVRSPFAFDEETTYSNQFESTNFLAYDFIQNPNWEDGNDDEPMLVTGNEKVDFKVNFILADNIEKGEFQIPFKVEYFESSIDTKISKNSIGQEIVIDKIKFKIKEFRNNQVAYMEPIEDVKNDDLSNIATNSSISITGDSKSKNPGLLLIVANKLSLDFLDTSIDEETLLKDNEEDFLKMKNQTKISGVAIFLKEKFEDHIKIEVPISKSYEFKITSPMLIQTKQ